MIERWKENPGEPEAVFTPEDGWKETAGESGDACEMRLYKNLHQYHGRQSKKEKHQNQLYERRISISPLIHSVFPSIGSKGIPECRVYGPGEYTDPGGFFLCGQ
mgnify:CR=1 FL=1